jgi:hypothetical protein
MNQVRMTAAEFRQYLAEQSQKKPSKHRNTKVYVYADGFVSYGDKLDNHGALVDHFDSVKEYGRYGELSLLEKAGKISKLKKQVPFLLHDSYQDSSGKKHRAIYYVADFTYNDENGKEIVEDVKGFDKKTGKFMVTSTFSLKWNLLQATYGGKEFRLF